MGPTKVIVRGDALHDAKTDKLIMSGLATPEARRDYAAHHYIVLPEVDNAGIAWKLDGQPPGTRRSTNIRGIWPAAPPAAAWGSAPRKWPWSETASAASSAATNLMPGWR